MNGNSVIVCKFILTILLSLIFSFCPQIVPAASTINIGMTAPLSGTAQVLGSEMRLGIETYFEKVNSHGGINGKKLNLIVYDDSYDPSKAAINMHRLIQQDNVLAVIGNIGTPTAVVSVPIAIQNKVLLFGAFSGANLLRKKIPDRYIINFRASYEQETNAIVKGLLNAGFKPQDFAFFTQNDSYGDDGYQGAMKALKLAGFENPEQLAHGRYNRNTMNVEQGLSEIIDSDYSPKVILIIGTYAPTTNFIKLAKQDFPNILFFNISFVNASILANELDQNSDNVYVTQVVPHFLANLPAINEYREDLLTYSGTTTLSFVSLEGYLMAKLFVLALKQAAAHDMLNRQGLIDTFESMHNVDLGIGIKINFSPENHQALNKVWLTKIKEKKIIPIDWTELNEYKQ